MKAFTDLEQSKKLAEILPIKSADMKFPYFGDGQYGITAVFGEPIEFSGGKDVPCWSLPALLDIFPCSKESPIIDLTRGGWNPSFTRRWFATWEDENKNVFYSCDGTSPIDAVVELIIKLHEQKLL